MPPRRCPSPKGLLAVTDRPVSPRENVRTVGESAVSSDPGSTSSKLTEPGGGALRVGARESKLKTGPSDKREPLVLGIDVGSTTVKAVALDPVTLEILWSDYQRHQTKQPEKVLELIDDIEASFPLSPRDKWRVFLTGSGALPLCAPIGGKFVQEVNAVTLAVEKLHPDVQSVIELGGQDAKIIMFNTDPKTGEKTASPSMNDKCASGTGATIDKCMIKVGLPPAEAVKVHFDDSKLHHVAAKCGVFAETDIVNLVKSGIPSTEILCSLADAIVLQNLSVLTRGSTLKHKVLLLGGPNT